MHRFFTCLYKLRHPPSLWHPNDHDQRTRARTDRLQKIHSPPSTQNGPISPGCSPPPRRRRPRLVRLRVSAGHRRQVDPSISVPLLALCCCHIHFVFSTLTNVRFLGLQATRSRRRRRRRWGGSRTPSARRWCGAAPRYARTTATS
jgi:hypothetical protein